MIITAIYTRGKAARGKEQGGGVKSEGGREIRGEGARGGSGGEGQR